MIERAPVVTDNILTDARADRRGDVYFRSVYLTGKLTPLAVPDAIRRAGDEICSPTWRGLDSTFAFPLPI